MKKQLIAYHCADEGASDHEIANQLNELVDFADMLGQDALQMYYDIGRPQDELQKAIQACREDNGYLLCQDIKSLCPDKKQAMDIIDALTDEMLFVMFVDDESTLKTIQG